MMKKKREKLIRAVETLIDDESLYSLSTMAHVFEICHKGLDDDTFCNTHCIHMVNAIKEDTGSYDAVDECMNDHCYKCPISFIISAISSGIEFDLSSMRKE